MITTDNIQIQINEKLNKNEIRKYNYRFIFLSLAYY